MPSPHAAKIVLTGDERAELEGWVRRRNSAAGLALRARIVLACADGGSNVEVAERLELDRNTISKWRNRFAAKRCDGLLDEPRPGRPRVVGDEQIEALITATLETTPPGATHWSTRSMAEHLGLSQSMVSRVWRAFGLAPHKQDSWKLSKDPLFVAKVRDIVGLYLNPPERAMVLCVDEKTQIQALNRTAPVFPMLPGTPARATHDYVRHGTTTLFAALEVATGKVTDACHPRHTHAEFLAFLKQVAKAYPRVPLHVVADNYATHKHPAVQAWLAKHPRVRMHFTPTSGSWLNLVEVFFGIITRQAIRRGTFTSVKDLIAAIETFIDAWNDRCQPFAWTKTADEILTKANRKPTSNTRH